MKINYAVSLWNYIHYINVASLERTLASLRQHDFGVELWNFWRNEIDFQDARNRKNLKTALDGMPVSLHSDIGDDTNTLDFHKQQIEIAAELGARIIVIHSDNLYLNNRKTLDISLANKVVAYAKTCGVAIALENGQLPILKEAIGKIEGLNICLDVGHVYLTKDAMLDFLNALKAKIIHLHIQEVLSAPETVLLGEEGIIFDHYTPGTGGIPGEDWVLFFNTLKEIDYQGAAVFEIQPRYPLQTALLGRNFMKELLP